MLRLLVYDNTCKHQGLTQSWWLGYRVYRLLGRFDACLPVSRWEQALEWLGDGDEPISEIQYWGHGTWGNARVEQQQLNIKALREWSPHFQRIAKRLTPASLWWFRTCETIGSAKGHEFTRAFSETLGCRVAGFTHIIGPWQSGLHSLEPGAEPDWDPREGVATGTAHEPDKGLWSGPFAPNTITCLGGTVPDGY